MIECLKEKWIKVYGILKTILTDQGRQFIGQAFQKELQSLGIKHYKTTTYNPTGNSIAERTNAEIGKGLRLLRDEGGLEALEKIQRAYNLFYNRHIKCSPIEAFSGENGMHPLRIKSSTRPHEINERVKRYSVREENKKYKKDNDCKEKDKVWLRKLRNTKMDGYWEGPYEIVGSG